MNLSAESAVDVEAVMRAHAQTGACCPPYLTAGVVTPQSS